MNIKRKKCTADGCDHGYITLLTSRKKCQVCGGSGEIVEEFKYDGDNLYYGGSIVESCFNITGFTPDMARPPASGGVRVWGLDKLIDP